MLCNIACCLVIDFLTNSDLPQILTKPDVLSIFRISDKVRRILEIDVSPSQYNIKSPNSSLTSKSKVSCHHSFAVLHSHEALQACAVVIEFHHFSSDNSFVSWYPSSRIISSSFPSNECWWLFVKMSLNLWQGCLDSMIVNHCGVHSRLYVRRLNSSLDERVCVVEPYDSELSVFHGVFWLPARAPVFEAEANPWCRAFILNVKLDACPDSLPLHS